MAILAVVVIEARKFAAHRLDLEMKREMLDRGVPPEEIERVLQGGEETTWCKKK